MPATITGVVFNDLNHNGVFEPGEPGIPNVFLTLFSVSASTCVQTSTDANGSYSFSVTTAGTYRIYETVEPAVSCPPTAFSQPSGFTLSNGPRVLSVTVTAAQIAANATIGNQNFSHDTIDDPLACTTTLVQFVNTPTEWFNIDIVTGVATLEGLLIPADNVNAIGYNILDNYIYAYDQTTNHIVRVDSARNLMQLVPNPTGLPSNGYNVGAFDLDGHLFLMVNNTARFYTVDLTPNSATFMKLVDPTNGYVEQTSNFGTALSITLNVSDWAYNPNDGFLYGVRPSGNTAQVMRVNPTTGAVTVLTTTLPALNPTGRSWGAVAMDASGALFAIYNGDGGVFRFTISGNTAVGDRVSTTFTTSFNDATMCPEALVGPIADMSVVKTASPDPVTPGDALTYSIVVANGGPDTAANVILTDAVPPELFAPEYSLNGGVTFFPWTGSLNLGTFVNGAVQTVLIRGTVDPSTVGAISNTATVDSDASDPDPSNNTSTVDVDVVPSADMAVVKTASPNPATAGGSITFTVVVSNFGPSDAQNVALTDVVPPQITGVLYSTDGGVTFLPWTGSLDLGTFAADTSQTILILGTVSSNVTGSFTNTAVVSSTTPDPESENNTSTVLVPILESADMAVNKTASPNPVAPGNPITFSLLVSNLGPSDAQNVELSDAVPPEVLLPEYSLDNGVTFFPWTGSLSRGTVPADTSDVILIRGTVSGGAVGSITNTAVVSSTTPDPDPDNNTSTVVVPLAEASADMAVVKTASPNPVVPGEVLTYTIMVSNLGPDTADNVLLTDAIPGQLTSPQYSTDGGVTFLPWTGSLSRGTVPAGTVETILIRGTVIPNASGSISNTAVVSSTTPDPDPDNNSSTAVVPVAEAAADMAVVKTASPNPISPGGVLTYTIVVSNLGPSAAQNVLLTDVFPGQLTNPQYSTDGGVTFLPWTGSLSLGTVPDGTIETILLRGTVIPNASGTISNTAVVSSTTPDPDPDNNTSTVIVSVCDARCQAITDLIESVALEEAALAHILNAKGEKLQKIIATPEIAPTVLLQTNQSVQSMTSTVTLLEGILSSKLSLFGDCLCDNIIAMQE